MPLYNKKIGSFAIKKPLKFQLLSIALKLETNVCQMYVPATLFRWPIFKIIVSQQVGLMAFDNK